MEKTPTSSRSILLAVCTAQFFLPFMMAGVNAVLPSIGADLGCSARQLGLVGACYALGLAVFQLTSGRMGDIWGRRRIFLRGMEIFVITGVVIAFMDDVEPVIALRFVQGMGAAMFNASGLAILAAAAPEGERWRYIGLSGAAVYAGIACGPPLGGLVVGALGWRWLFWGNSLCMLLAWSLMTCTVRREWRCAQGEPFDWSGCLAYGAAMATLTLGAGLLEGDAVRGWIVLGVGVLLLGVYVLLELRSAYPLLQVRLLASHPLFGLSALAAFINYSSMFGVLFFFSVYLQVVRGYSVEAAGLVLSVGACIQAVTTPWAGRLADRRGSAPVSAAGIGLCGVALLSGAFLGPQSSLWQVMTPLVILGFGVSLFAIPNTNIILGSVDERYLGQASGLVGAVRTSGGLVNMIAITVILTHFLGHAPASAENADAFLRSMRAGLCIFGGLNLLAVGCALGRSRFTKK